MRTRRESCCVFFFLAFFFFFFFFLFVSDEGGIESLRLRVDSGVTVATGRDVRVTLRMAVDVVAPCAAAATTAAAVVDADAGHMRVGTGLSRDGSRCCRYRIVGRRRRHAGGVGRRVERRGSVVARRHTLVDGIQSFGLFERRNLVGRRESLQSCTTTTTTTKGSIQILHSLELV